jgi:hypothetical protein
LFEALLYTRSQKTIDPAQQVPIISAQKGHISTRPYLLLRGVLIILESSSLILQTQSAGTNIWTYREEDLKRDGYYMYHCL